MTGMTNRNWIKFGAAFCWFFQRVLPITQMSEPCWVTIFSISLTTNVAVSRCWQTAIRSLRSSQTKLQQLHAVSGSQTETSSIRCHQTAKYQTSKTVFGNLVVFTLYRRRNRTITLRLTACAFAFCLTDLLNRNYSTLGKTFGDLLEWVFVLLLFVHTTMSQH